MSIKWSGIQPVTLEQPNLSVNSNGLVNLNNTNDKVKDLELANKVISTMNNMKPVYQDSINSYKDTLNNIRTSLLTNSNNIDLSKNINNTTIPTINTKINLGEGVNGFGTGRYSDGYKITRPTDGLKREYAPLQLQDPAHTKFALDEASKYGLDPKWVTGLIMAESSGRMLKPNKASAMGYMQVTPGVGQMYTKATGQKVNLMDPYDNIKVGMWDMDRLNKMYKGDIALASAAYNAGENRVDKWISGKRELPIETQQYVPRLFSYAGMI